VPDSVQKLLGLSVAIERGAGEAAGIDDAQFDKAGARVEPSAAATLEGARVVLQVQRSEAEARKLPAGGALKGLAIRGTRQPAADRRLHAIVRRCQLRDARSQAVRADEKRGSKPQCAAGKRRPQQTW
jgi:H+-translocating NAD(P) transhydrogenase subunit alpha